MKSRHICILTDHHICVNPRVWKEAFAYKKNGWDVTILTMWICEDHLRRDKEILSGSNIEYCCYLDLIPRKNSNLYRFYYRFRKWIYVQLFKRMGFVSKWLLNYAPEKMIQSALALSAHRYSAHLECALYAGNELLKKGMQVTFDFEDWYSQDYLVPERPADYLSELERVALHKGFFCTAASDSMSMALQNFYKSERLPITIYNSFPDSELCEIKWTDSINKDQFDIVWTSRTVGPGRGLEIFFKSLFFIDRPVHVHIIGDCSQEYRESLIDLYPSGKGHQLFFYGFIKHADLLYHIAQYDLGLAIEEYEPASRNKTVTNKILQYLQAGLMVLATDTDGQKEIASFFPDSVKVVHLPDINNWVKVINQVIDARLSFDRSRQKEIYNAHFSWAQQEKKLNQLINSI